MRSCATQRAVRDAGVGFGQGYLFARPDFPIPAVHWPG
jgi:EAL domain-containing protein (putative c-di-GMP-specific phosphodiesterase class I)